MEKLAVEVIEARFNLSSIHCDKEIVNCFKHHMSIVQYKNKSILLVVQLEKATMEIKTLDWKKI